MSASGAWLVVGLGNPGPTYAATRHNIGAMVIDSIAAQNSDKLSRHKRALADVCETRIAGIQTILAKPLSYMNESGGPVKALASSYKIAPDHIIVLHDELDIPLASIRVKLGGGDNGHNGLKSIRSSLETGDWYRIRLGIGRPPGIACHNGLTVTDCDGNEIELNKSNLRVADILICRPELTAAIVSALKTR